MRRAVSGLSARLGELTARVEQSELRQAALREDLQRELALKADRRLTAADRLAQQPVPALTVDEWLAECDVAHWLDVQFLYADDADEDNNNNNGGAAERDARAFVEALGSTSPAVALTRVLELFLADWRRRVDEDAAAGLPAASPPPIRGATVGRGRVLYWFLATNWGAVTGEEVLLEEEVPPPQSTPAPATPARSRAPTATEGNAATVLLGAPPTPFGVGGVGGGGTRPVFGGAATAAAAPLEADAMSEISDGSSSFQQAQTPAGARSARSVAHSVAHSVRSGAQPPPQHLVPLEGVWYRMDARKQWANIVTVLYQRYAEYVDGALARLGAGMDKGKQLALITNRAKCCSAAQLGKMRIAFFAALASVPGAVLV